MVNTDIISQVVISCGDSHVNDQCGNQREFQLRRRGGKLQEICIGDTIQPD